MMELERVPTGIKGLDVLIQGGFIRNRAIIIQGEPGTGKSTLALQFLVNGVEEHNERGVLISMENNLGDIIEDNGAFDWNIEELVRDDKLRIVTPPGGIENPEEISTDEMINFIFKHVNEIGARRLVVDSINSLEISIGKMNRQEMMRLITLLRELDCTTILVTEKTNEKREKEYMYMTHGVVELLYIRSGASRLRGIEVRKMRGTNHSNLIHSINIQSGTGIVVHPHELDLSS